MVNDNAAAEEPAPDPFEAELVAYLDGELDPAAARKVEARLAKDPVARARAAELKKSFDMLDYLPKPEPSATFTSRTIDRLPAVKSAPVGTTVPAPGPRTAGSKSRPLAAASFSTSVPVALELGDEPAAPAPVRPKRSIRVAAICAAVALCAGVGYLATAVIRPLLLPGHDKAAGSEKLEVDPRVIENLPLYAVADDLGFVAELAKPEFFGDDPAVAFDPGLTVPHIDTPDKSAARYDALSKAFRALPAARRAEVIKLDRELHALDPRTRDRYFRALEAYAVWLEHLPEAERGAVLSTATAGLRLGLVRTVRNQQWLDALPVALRSKPELIKQWREAEALRRDRWAFVRRHAEVFAANKSLWPFDTEAGRAAVVEFARDVLKVDEPKRCRLSVEELSDYRRVYQVAQRDGAWAWYGLLVYELASQHPYLPEPENAKLMLTEVTELPAEAQKILERKGVTVVPGALKAQIGRWPEFPLEAHRELSRFKVAFARVPSLGPAQLKLFRPAVREFAQKELFPKLSANERIALEQLEGRWPEYPQRFLHYARKYDLPVPGVTLPFAPKKWDALYGTPPAPAK